MMHLKPSPEYPGRHVHSTFPMVLEQEANVLQGDFRSSHSLISACTCVYRYYMTVCTTLSNSPWQLVASGPKMNPGIQSQEYLPVVMFVQIVFLPHGFCAHVTESAWTHYYTNRYLIVYLHWTVFPEFDSREKVLLLATPSIATNTIRIGDTCRLFLPPPVTSAAATI